MLRAAEEKPEAELCPEGDRPPPPSPSEDFPSLFPLFLAIFPALFLSLTHSLSHSVSLALSPCHSHALPPSPSRPLAFCELTEYPERTGIRRSKRRLPAAGNREGAAATDRDGEKREKGLRPSLSGREVERERKRARKRAGQRGKV
ncbi:Hypothetical protein NTJ_03189 [Nesidiocoris tenuis]|uniref:Uncharacterized protein n=1 Tax=Nesidiocoris tenuis TaxID=355587 RepID=A0ABN7ADM2_9HEMI|nr:Hypothetical protein NTJ_03189 [Nesidiocoris tenuis]